MRYLLSLKRGESKDGLIDIVGNVCAVNFTNMKFYVLSLCLIYMYFMYFVMYFSFLRVSWDCRVS